MSKIAESIRATIDGMLLNAGLVVSVVAMGEQVKENNWKCDAWRFTITPKSGKSESFDYFTGIGHRKSKLPRPRFVNPRCIAAEQWDRDNLKPVAPHVVGLLHSLVTDGHALEMCFMDWCAEYDYSTDSMSALATYNACCEQARRLQSLVGRDLYAKIAEEVQDY